MPTPFGGRPNVWAHSLSPLTAPHDPFGYRIISGYVWWRLIYWRWRLYLAARRRGTPVSAPGLSPAGSTVYFTDDESLKGVQSPSDFAHRMALYSHSHTECQRYGCAIVKFSLAGISYTTPPPVPPATAGITGGGAREWVTTANVALADGMEVTYTEITSRGPVFFKFTLRD
jgi:hypothetical protein